MILIRRMMILDESKLRIATLLYYAPSFVHYEFLTQYILYVNSSYFFLFFKSWSEVVVIIYINMSMSYYVISS